MSNEAGRFSLETTMFEQVFDDPTQTPRHTGIGTLIYISDSHTVGLVPIEDIVELVTTVNLYYDGQSWLVAYFP